MKKILLLFTGGTIGSSTNNNIIDVDNKTSYVLLKEYYNCSGKNDVEFEVHKPINILSENLIPADWTTICQCLLKFDFSAYEGIVITHGTDTLPYTAAAVSYLFSNISIPLVLTASNYPLEDPRSNGLENFINSVNFILNASYPGIFVIFDNTVHLGTRLTEAQPFSNRFDSANLIDFGRFSNRVFTANENPYNPTYEQMRESKYSFNIPNPNFSNDILYIRPTPGLNYNYYSFAGQQPLAILHDLYHSGTACTRQDIFQDTEFSILRFLEQCKEKHIDVFIAPVLDLDQDIYASLSKLINEGAIPLTNISVESAWVKLKLLYGAFAREKIISDKLYDKNLFFDKLIPLK